MDDLRKRLLNEFEVAWDRFKSAASLRDKYSTEMLLSVFRRRFTTKVEILHTSLNFAALRMDLSKIKIRVSHNSLVCLARIKEKSKNTAEIFRLLTTAYFGENSSGYCAIIIVCGNSNELKNKCRASYLDLITLDYQQMKEIIKSDSWSDEWAKALRGEKEPAILSPYDETGICPPEIFFGRESEIRKLTAYSRGHGHSVVGCRRVGKSSLLLKLKQHFNRIGEPTFYIDCQTCYSTENFYDEIVRRTNMRDYNKRKSWSLKGYLIRLAAMHKKPLNLFLDEVDWVIAWDKKKDYYFIIRELLSAESTTAISLKLWMAGFKDLYKAVTDRDSPLYGKTNAVVLNPLTFLEVKELVFRPFCHMGFYFENLNLIVKRIYEDTAGHPSFTQLYCRLLVDVLTEERENKVKLHHLDKVREKNDLIDYAYDTFVNNTSSLEKMIVLSVLEKKNFSLWDIKKSLDEKYGIMLKYAALYNELRDLRFGGILQQKVGSFSFQYPIMTNIIREIGIPDYIRDEHIDEARESARRVNAKS